MTTIKEEKLGQLLRPLARLLAVMCAVICRCKVWYSTGCKLPGWQSEQCSKETLPAAAGEMEGFVPLAVFACLLLQKRERQPKILSLQQLTAVHTHSYKVLQTNFVLVKDTTQGSATVQKWSPKSVRCAFVQRGEMLSRSCWIRSATHQIHHIL